MVHSLVGGTRRKLSPPWHGARRRAQVLTDAHATSAAVEAAVEMLGVKPVSDGIILDDDDTLYGSALPALCAPVALAHPKSRVPRCTR